VDEFTNKQVKQVYVKPELQFIDSFRFMPSSLDALTKNLTKDKSICLRKIGKKLLKKNYSDSHLDLLMKKGFYPYDYMDGLEKLKQNSITSKVGILFKTEWHRNNT